MLRAVEVQGAEHFGADAQRNAEQRRGQLRNLQAFGQCIARGCIDNRHAVFLAHDLAQECLGMRQIGRRFAAVAPRDRCEMFARGVAGKYRCASGQWKRGEQCIERTAELVAHRLFAARERADVAEQFQARDQFAQAGRNGRRRRGGYR